MLWIRAFLSGVKHLDSLPVTMIIYLSLLQYMGVGLIPVSIYEHPIPCVLVEWVPVSKGCIYIPLVFRLSLDNWF